MNAARLSPETPSLFVLSLLVLTAIPQFTFAEDLHAAPEVDPYIDATDCIAQKRDTICDSSPSDTWPHLATINQRDSQYNTEATVKIRMEGKGDPIKIIRYQQTILVVDDSISMLWNDPNGIRFDAAKFYVDQVQIPDELGFVIYSDYFQNGSYSEMRSRLTTNYPGVKTGIYGNSSGNRTTSYGFKAANDELIPKKKQGAHWAIIHITDGCSTNYGDPRPEVDSMVNEQIMLFNIGIFKDENKSEKRTCEPLFKQWSNMTGGKYYWVQNPADLAQVYKDIAQKGPIPVYDGAGKPPKDGRPMIVFKLTEDIEVVPGSFSGSGNYIPTSPSSIGIGNKGLRLEWRAPVPRLDIRQTWDVTFKIRSYRIYIGSEGIPVNDYFDSYISYDRYDGSPGGSDSINEVRVIVMGGGPPPPPQFAPPGPPEDPSTYISNDAISLFWSPPKDDGGAPILGFYVFRSIEPLKERRYEYLDTSSIGLTDNMVVPGVRYYYRITAINAIGESLMSDEVNASLPAPEDQNATHSIRVYARDALTHDPVMHASIYVDPGARFALTDAYGNREITEFYDWVYTITISAPGYQEQIITVEVRYSDVEVYFYMEKEVEGNAGGPSVQMGPLLAIFVLSAMLAVELAFFVSLVRNRSGGALKWPA